MCDTNEKLDSESWEEPAVWEEIDREETEGIEDKESEELYEETEGIESEETEDEETVDEETEDEETVDEETEDEEAEDEETADEETEDEETVDEETEDEEAEDEETVDEEIEEESEIFEESGDEPEIILPEISLPDPQYAFSDQIGVFGFSQQGESHKLSEVPCQDRCGFRIVQDKIILAAIADGVGSCVLSDYGAETAVNSSLDYLEAFFEEEAKKEDFQPDDQMMGRVLREMMQYAFDSVAKRAEEMEQLLYSFQSTLTVAVYYEKTLYFAHAGDDGIVALNSRGLYAMVTSRHKGEEASSVYPLQSRNSWQFGKVDDAAAFLMATDGVLDAFVRPSAEEHRVYYPFVEPIFYGEQHSPEAVKALCEDWYEYMASEGYRSIVTDDITILAVVNQKAMAEAVKPEFDFEEWEEKSKEYQEKRKAALYPPESHEEEKAEEFSWDVDETVKRYVPRGAYSFLGVYYKKPKKIKRKGHKYEEAE